MFAQHWEDLIPFFYISANETATGWEGNTPSTNVNKPDAYVLILGVSDALLILFTSFSRLYIPTVFRRLHIFFDSELSFCITRTFGTKYKARSCWGVWVGFFM